MRSAADQFRVDIDDSIEKHGRHLMGVGGSPTEMPFVYSIGNHERGLPEVLIVGHLHPRDMVDLGNAFSEKMQELGRGFTDGELIDLGGAVPCRAVHCRPSVRDEYTIQAGQYFGHEDYQVVQILLPDKRGRFPGDEGCESPYADAPVLR